MFYYSGIHLVSQFQNMNEEHKIFRNEVCKIRKAAEFLAV
jgi:hypothetical protein